MNRILLTCLLFLFSPCAIAQGPTLDIPEVLLKVRGECRSYFRRGVQIREFPQRTRCPVVIQTALRDSEGRKYPYLNSWQGELVINSIKSNRLSRKQFFTDEQGRIRIVISIRSRSLHLLAAGSNEDSHYFDPHSQQCAPYHATLAELQFCEKDSDCGVVVQHTSCGCTRNQVARNGADAEEFREVFYAAANLECVPAVTTCDCPEADGFRCAENRCGWNYL